MRIWLAILTSVLWCASATAQEPVSRFVALGDAPYGDPDVVFPPYRSLISNINKSNPALVLHLGDLHGGENCEDELMDRLRVLMDEFAAPVLYTPGDNEWTDCVASGAGQLGPLDSLDYLRANYFNSETTLGQSPEPVTTQADQGFPENARLMRGRVGFMTVHVVGSKNNLDPGDAAAMAEFSARNAANLAWLDEGFADMRAADAIVVALHADMFTQSWSFDGGWSGQLAYRDILAALDKHVSALNKPVLLLYGDSHVHKVHQPFPDKVPNLHAIEVYGHPDIRAIEISVFPAAQEPFRVTQVFHP